MSYTTATGKRQPHRPELVSSNRFSDTLGHLIPATVWLANWAIRQNFPSTPFVLSVTMASLSLASETDRGVTILQAFDHPSIAPRLTKGNPLAWIVEA